MDQPTDGPTDRKVAYRVAQHTTKKTNKNQVKRVNEMTLVSVVTISVSVIMAFESVVTIFSRVLRDSISHFSVRRSVGRLVGPSQSCFSRFSAPAHPSATNAAVYTALFFYFLRFFSRIFSFFKKFQSLCPTVDPSGVSESIGPGACGFVSEAGRVYKTRLDTRLPKSRAGAQGP